MKLIIIEGTDNTGKDTLISKLLEKYPTATLIHCGKPLSKSYSSKEQDTLFNTYIDNIINNSYSNTHVIIMNRSHIGEYVYGVLYRNRDEHEVLDMIKNIDYKLNKSNIDVRYVQLLCSSQNLLKNNEDGKSLSNGNIEKIEKEKNMFKNIFNESILINKKLFYVNDGDKFKSRETIFNEVWNFINN